MVEVRFREVVVDCADPRSPARFWVGFTGYELRTDRQDWATIGTADGSMIIGFQMVPEPKTVKNHVPWTSGQPTKRRPRARSRR
jgi:Glyoxalase-like domain